MSAPKYRRPRLTPLEREARKWSRLAGLSCLKYIRNALYPVFESDFELYEPLAVKYARIAWRWALKAEKERQT